MTTDNLTATEKKAQANYQKFIDGLTKLSKQTGIIIQVVGGVIIQEPADCKGLEYSNDITSGDILPKF
jgi:hypothetical protein